jgi:hypothetical protein
VLSNIVHGGTMVDCGGRFFDNCYGKIVNDGGLKWRIFGFPP